MDPASPESAAHAGQVAGNFFRHEGARGWEPVKVSIEGKCGAAAAVLNERVRFEKFSLTLGAE